MAIKDQSEDDAFAGVYDFFHNNTDNLKVADNDYIASKYDGKWWLRLILDIDRAQFDVLKCNSCTHQVHHILLLSLPWMMCAGFHFTKFFSKLLFRALLLQDLAVFYHMILK